MSTIERLYAPISDGPRPGNSTAVSDNRDGASALPRRVVASTFFWPMRYLSARRREVMYALHAFCREVEDIAGDEASRSLKQTLLLNWRSEIAHLYEGRPRHVVTNNLYRAIDCYGLRCDDFLAIIDAMEMDARAEIRAPSLEQLDRYCDCVAVAVARLAVRICGEETPAGEGVAAELGRALQLTKILGDLAKDGRRQRLYLPRELLHAHGIFATNPSWVLAQPALPDVCRDLAMLAEQHYSAAIEAIAACPRWTMRPAAVMLGIHRALLHELLVRGWRHIDEPLRIPAWHKLALVIRHGLAGR